MSELPEELVIMVLRKLSSTDQTRAGLVCRRWHTIILPYLWREIEVSGRRTPLHLRDPKNLLSLLTSGATSPMSPALHIQRLKLRAIRLDILDIFQLLKSLPRLRRLDTEWIVLHARDDTVLQPWQDSHRFQLERVHISWNLASGNGGRGLAELQLLDLFSEIRQLSLDYSAYGQTWGIDESDPRALESLVSPRCYSVHELVLNLGSVIPPQLNLLFQRNAFRDLTCLSVRITNVNALQNMNTLLCLAGGTLVELFLELRWDLSLKDQFNPILHENSVVRECSLRTSFTSSLSTTHTLLTFRLAVLPQVGNLLGRLYAQAWRNAPISTHSAYKCLPYHLCTTTTSLLHSSKWLYKAGLWR